MTKNDLLNRELIVRNKLERIRQLEKATRTCKRYYKDWNKEATIETNPVVKEHFLQKAQEFSEALGEIKEEKSRLIQELLDRYEYDYVNKMDLYYGIEIEED